jgi:hypothetical protein
MRASYEMINICPGDQHRARAWHWFGAGELIQSSFVKEAPVA